MSPKKETQNSKGLTAEEKATMKELMKERKAAANKEEEESAALAAIDAMQEPDRSMAKRIHAVIKDNAPTLSPKTWYGMPAYANNDGKVVCFFQSAAKFKARYATFGFNDSANLDEGNIWPVAYALTKLTPADEKKIAALVKKSSEMSMKANMSLSAEGKTVSQEIDAIIKEPGDWRGEKLSQLRALIKEADHAVVEDVKWKKPSKPSGVPVWSHDGNLCIADTLKNAVRLTFPKGAQMKDPKKLFNTRLDSKTVRAIDFHKGDLVDESALKALILEVVELNTSKERKR